MHIFACIFRHLLQVCELRYTPPSYNMSQQIISTLHAVEMGKLRKDLDGVENVGITIDGWSSRTTEACETYTVHYIKDW